MVRFFKAAPRIHRRHIARTRGRSNCAGQNLNSITILPTYTQPDRYACLPQDELVGAAKLPTQSPYQVHARQLSTSTSNREERVRRLCTPTIRTADHNLVGEVTLNQSTEFFSRDFDRVAVILTRIGRRQWRKSSSGRRVDGPSPAVWLSCSSLSSFFASAASERMRSDNITRRWLVSRFVEA